MCCNRRTECDDCWSECRRGIVVEQPRAGRRERAGRDCVGVCEFVAVPGCGTRWISAAWPGDCGDCGRRRGDEDRDAGDDSGWMGGERGCSDECGIWDGKCECDCGWKQRAWAGDRLCARSCGREWMGGERVGIVNRCGGEGEWRRRGRERKEHCVDGRDSAGAGAHDEQECEH